MSPASGPVPLTATAGPAPDDAGRVPRTVRHNGVYGGSDPLTVPAEAPPDAPVVDPAAGPADTSAASTATASTATVSTAAASGKVVVAATVVGLLTGFFGVGGGFVIVPALVLALGFDMPTAVGTSLLVITINSAAALAARFGGHVHLDWPLLAVFTAAALAGTVAGNRVASWLDASRLTAAFTVLLAAVAVYSLGRSLPGLV